MELRKTKKTSRILALLMLLSVLLLPAYGMGHDSDKYVAGAVYLLLFLDSHVHFDNILFPVGIALYVIMPIIMMNVVSRAKKKSTGVVMSLMALLPMFFLFESEPGQICYLLIEIVQIIMWCIASNSADLLNYRPPLKK